MRCLVLLYSIVVVNMLSKNIYIKTAIITKAVEEIYLTWLTTTKEYGLKYIYIIDN